MAIKVKDLDTAEILKLYSEILRELKDRNVIRSKNLVGELGEHLAIDYYNKNIYLPNLKLAPTSTKSFDAIDEDGRTYAIKTITGKVTGVFYGLNSSTSTKENKQIFDFAIVIKLDENYAIHRIFQLDWNQFLANKKWHSRMKAWNLTISKKLTSNCSVIK